MKLYPKKAKKPLRAIRLFCGECMGMSRLEEKVLLPFEDIKGCTDEMCPLFEFRHGRNPFMKREMSESDRDALRKSFTSRMKAYR